MKNLVLMLACAVVAGFSYPCLANEDISPVLLDAKDGEGSTIGLKFEFSGSRHFTRSNEAPAPSTDGTGVPGEPPPVEVFEAPDTLRYRGFAMKYRFAGTVAAEEEKNPENLIDSFIDVHFKFSNPDALGTITGGVLLKYETDQSFDNQQFVYGLSATYGKLGILDKMDFFSIDVRRGQVDPSEDKARQAALGAAELDTYYRNEIELLYMYPISATIPFLGKMASSFEFNYRHYEESGAPAAIEGARLDKFFLRTFRLNLQHDLFIAYSKGKLPFDVKEDEYFTLGFKYQLK